MLSIRLPSDIENRLDKLSRVTGRSKSFYIRSAIIELLDQIEKIRIEEQLYFEKLRLQFESKKVLQDHF